jgi:hypothetical protein
MMKEFGVATEKVKSTERVGVVVRELSKKNGPELINLIVAETAIHQVRRLCRNSNPDFNKINITWNICKD